MNELLPVKGRTCLRIDGPSFLDARDWLGKVGGLAEEDYAQIATYSLELSSGQRFYLVHITLVNACKALAAMRPCRQIRAATKRGAERVGYDPMLFDGARLYGDGRICLRSGSTLYSGEIVPVNLARRWGPKENRIVSLAVAFSKAEKENFLEVDWQSYPDKQEVVYRPAVAPKFGEARQSFINYAAVSRLQFGKHKFEAFLAFVKQHTPDFNDQLSRQAIADILRHANVRLPRSLSRP